ncbi:MAG: helix-turn-helix transcriptional regulator [Desulfarculus sp.]|nr:helix-turn-helix transcriptional regulator [Desulfarculus sp.]
MSVFIDKAGFLERLESVRRSAGLSKGEFAQRVGVAQIFSRYSEPKPGQKERKVKAPSVETLLVIAAEFHTSVDWLLTGRAPEQHATAGKTGAVPPAPAWMQDLMPRLAKLDPKGQSLVRGTLEGLLNSLAPQQPTADAQPPPVEAKTGTGGRKAKRATG